MKLHSLRIRPDLFRLHLEGELKFEITKNENYQTGDTVVLERYDGEYTNHYLIREVTHVRSGGFEGLQPGYCAIGLKVSTYGLTTAKRINLRK